MKLYKNIYILVFFVVITYLVYKYLTKNRDSQFENYSNELFNKIKEGKENNYWEQTGMGIKAKDCYSLTNKDCMNYSNCGICFKDGRSQCIPGDTQGPFFKEDCEQWQHTNYYDRHIFGERVTTITSPWNKFYPEFEARYPSPQSRGTL